MKRIYKYKTLEGLLRQASNNIVTLDDMLCNRIRLRNRGWCDFELNTEERERFAIMCADSLGGNYKTMQAIVNVIASRSAGSHGIYRRLQAELVGKRVKCEYCAGQDAPSERRLIRQLLTLN